MKLLMQFGAFCGIISGALLGLPGAVEAFTGETLITSVLIGLAPALAAPLLTGLYVSHFSRSARPGGPGYAVNMIGLGFFGATAFALNIVVFPLGDIALASVTRVVVLAGAAVYVIGTVWFGIELLRARVHPRPAALLYLIAMPLFPVAAQLPDSPVTAGLHVVAAVGLVWLGASLHLGARLAVREPDGPQTRAMRPDVRSK